MRALLVIQIFLTTLASIVLAGCDLRARALPATTAENPPDLISSPPPLHHPIRHETSASTSQRTWKLHYFSKCAQQPSEKCVGFYGFSIDPNGTFQVGPGPDQQKWSGILEENELQSVELHLVEASLNPDASPLDTETCIPHSPLEATVLEKEETIELSLGAPSFAPIEATHPVGTVRNNTKELCFKGFSKDHAQALQELLMKLTLKHYPGTFPNPCIDATSELDKRYAQLKSCEKNSDCSYIDTEFLPISHEKLGKFVIDDCSYIRPVLVANGFSCVSNQLDLLKTRDLARQVCQNAPKRSDCDHPQELQNALAPPVCIRNLCQKISQIPSTETPPESPHSAPGTSHELTPTQPVNFNLICVYQRKPTEKGFEKCQVTAQFEKQLGSTGNELADSFFNTSHAKFKVECDKQVLFDKEGVRLSDGQGTRLQPDTYTPYPATLLPKGSLREGHSYRLSTLEFQEQILQGDCYIYT